MFPKLDLQQFKFLADDVLRQTEEARAVLRAEVMTRRRCTATRRDGLPCRAWATWDDPEQRCAPHRYQFRRGDDEMTEAIRRANRRGRAPVCHCAAYGWPHREGRGLCRWPEEPIEKCPTPAGSRRPGKLRRRKVQAILRKIQAP